jgi:hypothetical protein
MQQLFLPPIDLNVFKETIKECVKDVLVEMKEGEEEKLLSINKVTQLFDPAASTTTVRKWTKEGKLQAYVIGGRILYKQSQVMEAATKITRYSRSQIK